MISGLARIAAICHLSLEAVEHARLVIRRPKAMLTILKGVPPLPRESVIQPDPDLYATYPAPFIHWSQCMHGLANWESIPVLSYDEYIKQIEFAFQPTEVVLDPTPAAND